jgi:glycosyltransferase involved in cell wall biosynthesis
MLLHAYYKRDPRVRREAEALVQAGHVVDVICLNEGEETEHELFNGVRIFRCAVSRSRTRRRIDYVLEYLRFFVRAWRKLARLNRAGRYDVMIAHNMPNFLVFATFPWRFLGTRVILDLHDPSPEHLRELFGLRGGFLERLVRFEERIAVRFAHRVITVNEPIAEEFHARTRVRPFVSHNMPDERVVNVRKTSYESPTGPLKLVYHGYVNRRYGLDRLIDALLELNRERCRFTLDIYGDGPHLEAIRSRVQGSAAAEWCALHGGFAVGAINGALITRDLAVALYYPSAMADLALPAKVLESVFLGLPVVCPDLRTVRYYFGGESLFMFRTDGELRQVLEYVAANYGDARDRANRARQQIEPYLWKHERRRFVRFVEEAAAAR